MKLDLTVVAIPAYVAAMGAEYLWQRRHPVPAGTRAGDYQLADTLASFSMGLGSLIAPVVVRKVIDPITPTKGRFGKALVATAVATTLATSIGDVVRRRLRDGSLPPAGTVPPDVQRVQDELTGLRLGAELPAGDLELSAKRRTPLAPAALAVSAVASTALTVATTWAAQTSGERLFARTSRDLGGGALALAVAVFGWDFLYYWNHRADHESRWLWAMHVVHHSSERYNLSTALRQPVAEGITMTVPYGALALLGVRPSLIEHARGLNLIYQFWIHTEAINRIGRLERVLNTPSHHRVHHGSNRDYLDRNHGSILIIWDKLFGTFEPEGERVVYGLTKNIDTYNPLRIATHEWVDIAKDIAVSTTWRDRWSYLLRGPGWAYARRETIPEIIPV